MYKPGEVTSRLGLDPKTVYSWVEKFGEFFSDGAKGGASLQRIYSEEDLLVLNSILRLRAQKQDFEKIRAQLAAGYRDTELPPTFYEMEGDKAVMIYSQLKTLEVALDNANQEIERLRAEVKSKDGEKEPLQKEIIRLNRQIAVLEYRLGQKEEGEQ